MKKMTVLATALTSGVGKAATAMPNAFGGSGVVRIAADTAYPAIPTVKDDSSFEGFDVDLARALGAAMDIDFKISQPTFETLPASRQAGKVVTLRELCGYSVAQQQASVNGADQAVEK